MIITGGENVYSAEVEAAMLKHPTVAQVAVIGTPDVRWGEKVTALIVTRPGASITEAELQQHCRSPLFGRFLQSAIGGSQDAPHIVECAHAALFRQRGEKLKLGARRQPTLDLSHLLTEFRKSGRAGDSLFDGFVRRLHDRGDSTPYDFPLSQQWTCDHRFNDHHDFLVVGIFGQTGPTRSARSTNLRLRNCGTRTLGKSSNGRCRTRSGCVRARHGRI
jgi:hypothetical protein